MKICYRLFAIAVNKTLIPLYDFYPIFKLTPDYREAKQLIQRLRDFNEKVNIFIK